MPTNLIAAVVVAVGLIIAAMFGRYEIVSHGSTPAAVSRLDRLTGKVQSCIIGGNTEIRPKWCERIQTR